MRWMVHLRILEALWEALCTLMTIPISALEYGEGEQEYLTGTDEIIRRVFNYDSNTLTFSIITSFVTLHCRYSAVCISTNAVLQPALYSILKFHKGGIQPSISNGNSTIQLVAVFQTIVTGCPLVFRVSA